MTTVSSLIIVAPRRAARLLAAVLAISALGACGGGGSSYSPPPTYSIGGTTTGLVGSGLALEDNGGDGLSVAANGVFTFLAKLARGSSYSVSVKAQPTNPTQTCVVMSGSGTVGSNNVTSVAVACSTQSYAVGGTITNLAGSGLVLQDNGADDLAIGASGVFQFATPVPSGEPYQVVVKTQPSNPQQSCVVVGGSGTITSSAVTGVVVHCGANKLSLVAGHLGGPGSIDATGTAARFANAAGVAVDASGNVYVADTGNHTIRKITPAGVVTSLAGAPGSGGSTDATGSAARFYFPNDLAVDSAGNLYVADSMNNTIRKVTPVGVVTTFAGAAGTVGSQDGSGAAARFFGSAGVAIDASDNLYVADTFNMTIRKITPAGVVTTIAGTAGMIGNADGAGAAARFNNPYGIAVDRSGIVYVADSGNGSVRRIDPAGAVSTLAHAPFPLGIGTDATGNVYVANQGDNTIDKITPAGVVTTLAGTPGVRGTDDGTGPAAQFASPEHLVVDAGGAIYVADTLNSTVRRITSTGAVTTFAGAALTRGSRDGSGAAASFSDPVGVAADAVGNIYVADSTNHTIRKITAAGVVTTLAGTAGVPGSSDGSGSSASFRFPNAVAVDAAGVVYVLELGNHAVRKITPGGVVTTLAGSAQSAGYVDATGNAARFSAGGSIVVDSAGNILLTDSGNHAVRKVTAAGVVTTVAGGTLGAADGTGTAAQFSGPTGLGIDGADILYVADSGNVTIRKLTPTGVVTTIAGTSGQVGSTDGTGPAARFEGPLGLAATAAGIVYAVDSGPSGPVIRQITASGVVTTVVGVRRPAVGVLLGPLPGLLQSPQGLALLPSPATSLIIAEEGENAVLRADLP